VLGRGDPLAPDRRRKAVAIEPMSCPPNAFVTGDDLLVLEPGEVGDVSGQRRRAGASA
jgi:galactose mutarotase-like enzyme